MTTTPDTTAAAPAADAQSSLAFDPVAVLKSGIRVNQTELGKLLGVSKQSVSSWRKRGLISVGADGLINPTEAARQLARNADPRRLRAKVLSAAVADTGQLLRAERQRAAALEAQLDAERRHCEERHVPEDDLARDLQRLMLAIEQDFPHLTAAAAAGRLAVELDALVGRHVWHLDQADIDALLAEADDDEPAA